MNPNHPAEHRSPTEVNPWRDSKVTYHDKEWTVGSRVGQSVWLRDEFGQYMLVEISTLHMPTP